ncbi:MAG: hypothetical protein LV481_08160 [Methylacidiphilales bacterium]|nr:hypothetical protein [Candidatus Methylacidiphilales bacterium]
MSDLKLTPTLLITAMAFSLFGSKAQATPEQQFWGWFTKNESTLFDFEKDQERIFDQLAMEMKKVNPNLTFEFGPKEDGKREFVISADGIKEAFPAVISLYDSAPKLPRWTFIKFRPRREPMDIEYSGVKVEAKDVYFTLEPDGNKAGITVFISGYTEDQRKTYMGIAFLMLDQALGEYDMETKVGFINIKDSTDQTPLEKKALTDLPATFDSFIQFAKKE